jgi:NTP pyrophosphatase (non-canonical NTP hydrolase)
MNTRLEELLIILMEECAEVSQAASKCMRFGLPSTHPEGAQSNQLRLESEIGDFMAIVKLLTEEYNLNMDNIIAAADAKLVKVEKYMRNPKLEFKRRGIPPVAPLGKQATFPAPKRRKNKPNS